jgi:hypothetical protein
VDERSDWASDARGCRRDSNGLHLARSRRHSNQFPTKSLYVERLHSAYSLLTRSSVWFTSPARRRTLTEGGSTTSRQRHATLPASAGRSQVRPRTQAWGPTAPRPRGFQVAGCMTGRVRSWLQRSSHGRPYYVSNRQTTRLEQVLTGPPQVTFLNTWPHERLSPGDPNSQKSRGGWGTHS